MKQLNKNKIFLVLLLIFVISCNQDKSNGIESFNKEKDKVDKILNEQKLSNYLRKLMIKVKIKLFNFNFKEQQLNG